MGFIQNRFCISGIACRAPDLPTVRPHFHTRCTTITHLQEEEAEEEVVNAVEPPADGQPADDHDVHRRVPPRRVPQWLSAHQRPLVSLLMSTRCQEGIRTCAAWTVCWSAYVGEEESEHGVDEGGEEEVEE
jgi:hypothetical protein